MLLAGCVSKKGRTHTHTQKQPSRSTMQRQEERKSSNKREGQTHTQERTNRVPGSSKSKHMPSNLQNILLPQRVCCPWLCAMPVQHLQAPEQAREDTAPRKIDVTSNPPVGGISVVTLIRTDTTLDHSQKAEKV